MAENMTVSYSDGVKGWPSRFSYVPEFLTGLNTYLYSFDGGNLYRHNTNPLRNNYYGVQEKSTITGVFNDRPLEIKLFKTMSFESDAAWSCIELKTDLSSGSMLFSDFEQKEGEWFSYIRENANTVDFKLRSANGIGDLVSRIGAAPNLELLTFNNELGNIISGGDVIYFTSVSGPKAIGIVSAIDKANKQITLDYSAYNPPAIVPGDFLYYYKNVVAESTGARGYFMEFTLELPVTETQPVELFSVSGSVMKSFP